MGSAVRRYERDALHIYNGLKTPICQRRHGNIVNVIKLTDYHSIFDWIWPLGFGPSYMCVSVLCPAVSH